MQKSLVVIYLAIALDAVGIGLVFPILPALMAEVTGASDVAPYIGVASVLYALLQFVCAPVLGALSDRFGRRPVLMASMAGAAVDYAFLAVAPTFPLFLVGRAIAGMTSANVSVATAVITDISPTESRARRFGLANAMFGVGFIVGPVLGGLLGDVWVRLPFLAAAAMNGCNLLLALVLLPETRDGTGGRITLSAFDPIRPLRRVASERDLRPVVALFFLFSLTGEAYGTCWAVWGSDAFGWSGLWIGLSLGAFGVCQTLSQAVLPGPAVKTFGERGAILVGIGAAVAALAVMAVAAGGWVVFAIMPLFALGGIGMPALQSLATRQVPADRQGEFQGVLASVLGFASIVGPAAFPAVYVLVRPTWPGAIWFAVVAVYLAAVPLVLRLGAQHDVPESSGR